MEERIRHIGILGIGAIGTVIAYNLVRYSCHRLLFFNRTPKNGLKLVYKEETHSSYIKTIIHPVENIELDWLIICLKEHQFETAQNWWPFLIQKKTKVVVIRNGLRHIEPLLSFVRSKNILPAIIDCPTQPLQLGFYEQIRKAQITLPDSNLAKDFASLFQPKEITFILEADFKTSSWKKLCESAALGAILCLSGETCWIFQDEEMQDLYLRLLEECLSVAQKDGAKIEDSFKVEMLEKLLKYPPTKRSSMLTDRQKGNPIELGAKNGVIVKLAKEYDIITPLNDLVVQLLKHTNKL